MNTAFDVARSSSQQPGLASPQRPSQNKKPKLPRPSSSSASHPQSHSIHPPPANREPLDSTSPPPADSAPDLSKVRAYAACRNCRVKKIKCLPTPSAQPSSIDSPQPPGPCQQCTSAGVECTYPPTRDRAAYSRQYVQNLEARVQALEMVNSRLMPLLEAFERGGEGTALADVKALPVNGHAGGPVPAIGGRQSLHESPTKLEQIDNAAAGIPIGRGLDGESDSDDLDRSDLSDVGQITQDERGNYRWIGPSNTLSLLDNFSSRHPEVANGAETNILIPDTPNRSEAPSRNSNPYFGPVAGAGVVKALPGVDEVSYPSREAAEEMVNAFFSEVHPCLPTLIEHDFRTKFKELMDRKANGEIVGGGGFISVVFAVFALGERVVVTTRAWQREREKLDKQDKEGKSATETETVLPGEAEAGVIWYERAQILHYTTLKDVNIHQVQCLTLLAAFQASVNAVPMSWLLAGQALRVAQDLGLHRSTARLKLPFAEKQLRARCWWAIYGLERMVSISLGRPLGVDDLDIDVAYPANVDDAGLLRIEKEDIDVTHPETLEEPQGSVMSGFVALTKLCKIAGKVAHLLYRPHNGKSVADASWATSQQNNINRLDKHLRDWLASEVPAKYKDPSADRMIQLLSAVLSNSYLAVRITLHRNFLPPSPDFLRPQPLPSSLSLSHCVDSARSVLHIAAQSRVLVPPSHHLALFCQHLWSSAVILLLCEVQARDQNVANAVDSQIEACRRSLQALEPVWPGCRKLKELLNDAESRAKEMVVATEAARASKKRKIAGDVSPKKQSKGMSVSLDRPNLSQRSSRDSSAFHNTPTDSTDGLIQLKRPRVGASGYETSDTRTFVQDEDLTSAKVKFGAGTPGLATIPGTFTLPQQAVTEQPQTVAPFDLFDVGGMTFDGLEMLQGFTGDVASLWTALAAEQWLNTSPAPAGGGTTGVGHVPGFSYSGQNTPNSNAGSGSGGQPTTNPSPGAWQFTGAAASTGTATGNGTTGNGTGTGTATGNGNGVSGLSPVNGLSGGFDLNDFWSQVNGGSFDWQADPAVPFNI